MNTSTLQFIRITELRLIHSEASKLIDATDEDRRFVRRVKNEAWSLGLEANYRTLKFPDLIGTREAYDNTNLEFKTRAEYYSNADQLKQLTSANGELLALSNLKNPYPGAKLGVVEAGAYADLLIVDGSPIDDIMLMLDYENNFKLIMKNGAV